MSKKPDLQKAKAATAKAAKKVAPKKKAPAKRKAPAKLPTKIDWSEAQKDYLLDATISYKDIAERYGVSQTAVEKHAKAAGWVELRNKLGEQATNLMLKRLASKKASANDRHFDQYKSLQSKIMTMVDKLKEDSDPAEAVALARALDIATKGERVVLGLPTNINAVTDKDGEDVLHGLADLVVAANKVVGDAASGS